MKFNVRTSLALWRRRLAVRQRLLRSARKANIGPRIERRKLQVREAETMIAHREQQLAAANPLRVRALRLAVEDLDVRETAGNNWGGKVTTMIRGNDGTGPEPWCGDAVAYWYRRAGSKLVRRAWASTIWLLAKLTPVRQPLAGHVVVYDFDGSGNAKHTGLFERWIVRGESFSAIEGNTNPSSSASDSGGGEGVHRRTRNLSTVAGFRRVAG